MLAMSNTTQMPTKSTLRQDCLTPGKFFQSAALAILCHDSKDAFHSECSLLASLFRFLVIILTDTSLQIVNLLSRRIFTVCKVLYSAHGVVKDMGFVDAHRDLRNRTHGRKREWLNEQVQTIDQSHFMERAMGIEPTSEAWEALNKTLKAIDLAALSLVETRLSWKLDGN